MAKIIPEAQCHVYEMADEEAHGDHGNWLAEIMKEFGAIWSANFLESLLESMPIFAESFDSLKASYDDLSKIVDQVRPDFIVFDQPFSTPGKMII